MGNTLAKVSTVAAAVWVLAACSDGAPTGEPASTSSTSASTSASTPPTTTASQTTTTTPRTSSKTSTPEAAPPPSTTTQEATTTSQPPSPTSSTEASPTVVDCGDVDNLDLTSEDPDSYVCDEYSEDSARIGHNNEVLPKTKSEWRMFCSSPDVSQKNKDDYCFTKSGGLDSIDCDALTEDPYAYCFDPEPEVDLDNQPLGVDEPGYCEDETIPADVRLETCDSID